MLKNIDPLLNAELLGVLRAMGHGDDIIVVDVNYPAASTAADTVHGKVIQMGGADTARVVQAILSVMPLDAFVDAPAARMEVVGAPDEVPPVQSEVQAKIDAAESKSWPMQSIERMAFYEHAKSSYAVVATGDRRFYGCFSLKKGVIGPDEGA